MASFFVGSKFVPMKGTQTHLRPLLRCNSQLFWE